VPELPEIHTLAKQMDRKLRGLRVGSVTVHQGKCLNVPVAEFTTLVTGRTVGRSARRGKWVFVDLRDDTALLLNLGMGGDALYHAPGEALPEKYQVAFHFEGGSALSLRFWWFGYVHAVPASELGSHKMTASLGLDPLSKKEFTLEAFRGLLHGRRGALKQLLLDQNRIAGIGNVYIQDSLFLAGLHPSRPIPSLSEDEVERLHAAIVRHLTDTAALGGLRWEKDLFGKPGRFEQFLVGYQEGKPCPSCGTTVEKIKTGSTASYICPRCQV
jgi:formamidopyrimidine-DNA glycosylase